MFYAFVCILLYNAVYFGNFPLPHLEEQEGPRWVSKEHVYEMKIIF